MLVSLEDLDRIDAEIADYDGTFSVREMAEYEDWLYRMDLIANGYGAYEEQGYLLF